MAEFTKWVACYGNAISYTDRKEATFGKNLTLRYPIKMVFDGDQLRFHFSNLTGKEDVRITKAYADKTVITFDGGGKEGVIPAGKEIVSDAIPMGVKAGETLQVSLYFKDYVELTAGTFISGPCSGGQYAYGDYAGEEILPADFTRNTNWYYFLSTIDVHTKEENRAVVCYGDSITAGSWPDYLMLRCEREGYKNVAIIRRAVSGTRVLRQYDCITYQAYGLKGAIRFPIESEVAGADTLIIQHGINDIIHPVGEEVNKFRPMSDLPTAKELCEGIESLYVKPARELGYQVYSGTLLPIYGWRTYADFREELKNEVNAWLRTADIFDGCIDFDQAVRDAADSKKFADGYDSGDHLHPSEKAYEAMAEAVPEGILGGKKTA
ncbi:MAG: GDSL-type esterase/lipase family protein [Lachnospiraceae bacterium]|nr:GDSL-type esterase/lipase family protein [Lachnospiraceae bacterium]